MVAYWRLCLTVYSSEFGLFRHLFSNLNISSTDLPIGLREEGDSKYLEVQNLICSLLFERSDHPHSWSLCPVFVIFYP